jgi:hypothetical protein
MKMGPGPHRVDVNSSTMYIEGASHRYIEPGNNVLDNGETDKTITHQGETRELPKVTKNANHFSQLLR